MDDNARKAVAGSTRDIFGTGILNVDEAFIARLPKKSSLERKICRSKSTANIPYPDPTTGNFVIPGEFRELVIHDTGVEDPERILALGDPEILGRVRQDTEWYIKF